MGTPRPPPPPQTRPDVPRPASPLKVSHARFWEAINSLRARLNAAKLDLDRAQAYGESYTNKPPANVDYEGTRRALGGVLAGLPEGPR